MRPLALLAVLGTLSTAAAAVDVYRWVDEKGVVHYTDQPAPPQAKQERKRFSTSVPAAELPYATREAAKNFPVVLFAGDCGDNCNKAVAFLSERGIPFTSRDARDPVVAKTLKAISGGLQVPVITIGREVVKGFSDSSWGKALSLAGYPRNPLPPALVRQSQPGGGAPVPATGANSATTANSATAAQ